MALVQGCYLGPVELVDDNRPPVIVNATNLCQDCTTVTSGSTTRYCDDCGLAVRLERDENRVWVAAVDEQPLSYVWDVAPYFGRVYTAETLEDGSQVTLADDPDLDGQVLTCVVTDGTLRSSISWTLEVP